MNGRKYLLLFLLGIGVVSAVATYQHVPGYMDAEYYYAGALRIATGNGLTENYLWNYLNDPAGLPQPSHAYWMPLASLLAALGMQLSGTADFYTARLPFLVIAGCLPPLTAALAWKLSGKMGAATLAGILAALAPFYLPYLGTTDNFGVYMLLGGLFCLVFQSAYNGSPSGRLNRLAPAILGLIAGLMHLARADGFIWLLAAYAAVLWNRPALWWSARQAGASRRKLALDWLYPLAGVTLGYLVVMLPWFYRNLALFGSPLSQAGTRTLWLTSYDELFSYPAELLTPARWWASGLEEIFGARVRALGQNLLSALAVQGSIFLAPLILWGFWRLRQHTVVRLGSLIWLLILLAMTIGFPYSGTRGGFFHSGAALQPLLWAAVPVGLEAFIAWGRRVRGWEPGQAQRFFTLGLVCLAFLLALYNVRSRVIGADFDQPAWEQSWKNYTRLEGALQAAGAAADDIVAVNNAPGYFAAAGRKAITVPYGDEGALVAAARRYGARYVILEYNHPTGLADLYLNPRDRPGLIYLQTFEQSHLFRVDEFAILRPDP